MAKYRIGVFASGGGSNLQALMDRIRSGELPADLAFVLSNNSKSGALAKAKSFGTQAFHVSGFTEGGEDKAAARMASIVKESGIDLLVLAGYMKRVPEPVHALLMNRILNIHPALLPKFGGKGMFGRHIHEAVLAAGERTSGITIHHVDGEYDHGAIVAQREVPVMPGDTVETLQQRIMAAEPAFFVETLQAMAAGRKA